MMLAKIGSIIECIVLMVMTVPNGAMVVVTSGHWYRLRADNNCILPSNCMGSDFGKHIR